MTVCNTLSNCGASTAGVALQQSVASAVLKRIGATTAATNGALRGSAVAVRRGTGLCSDCGHSGCRSCVGGMPQRRHASSFRTLGLTQADSEGTNSTENTTNSSSNLLCTDATTSHSNTNAKLSSSFGNTNFHQSSLALGGSNTNGSFNPLHTNRPNFLFRRFHASAAARAVDGQNKAAANNATADSNAADAASTKNADGGGKNADSESTAASNTAAKSDTAKKGAKGSAKESDELVAGLRDRIQELEIKLEESKEKVDDTINKLRYAQADGENARKRSQVEVKIKLGE